MKKTIVFLMLAFLLCLSGCTEAEDGKPAGEQEATQEERVNSEQNPPAEEPEAGSGICSEEGCNAPAEKGLQHCRKHAERCEECGRCLDEGAARCSFCTAGDGNGPENRGNDKNRGCCEERQHCEEPQSGGKGNCRRVERRDCGGC